MFNFSNRILFTKFTENTSWYKFLIQFISLLTQYLLQNITKIFQKKRNYFQYNKITFRKIWKDRSYNVYKVYYSNIIILSICHGLLKIFFSRGIAYYILYINLDPIVYLHTYSFHCKFIYNKISFTWNVQENIQYYKI